MSERHKRWILAVAVLVLYTFAQPWYARGHVSDVHATTYPAWHVVETGSWDLSGHATNNPWFVEVEGGGEWTNRAPGAIAVAITAYFVTSPFTDGYEVWPGVSAAVITAWLAVLIVAAIAERLRPGTWPLAFVAFGLGTGTWGIAADQLWPHAPAQLAIALSVWWLIRERTVASGLAMALAVLIRPLTVILGLGVAAAKAWKSRSYRPLLSLGLPPLLAAFAYLLYNRFLFGSWSPTAAYEVVGGFVADFGLWDRVVNVMLSLVEPSHGLLIWSPWILLALFALHRVKGAVPDWLNWTPWIAATYIVAHSLIEIASGALYYNYRYQLEAVTLAAPLLVVASAEYEVPGPKRMLMTAAIAASVLLQATYLLVAMCWPNPAGELTCRLFP